MKLQVLVSVMHQTDHSLLEKMNIRSDAIVVNQCDRDCIERFTFRGHNILWMSFNERGVGLSRNNALMRADGDILLFADDDVVYMDDYVEKVTRFFERHPKADLAVFNLQSLNADRPAKIIEKEYRMRWFNSGKFGTFRIAVRKESLRRANVYFSLLFGGGARYQSGEDSLFIVQCLKKGMRGVAGTEKIGTVEQKQSTWFKGCDERYFFDKGVLMKQCFVWLSKPVVVALLAKHRHSTAQLGFRNALREAFKGTNSI